MPRISKYPDGGIFAPSDEIVIARSGVNFNVDAHGVMQFINPVFMVDSLGNTWNNFAAAIGTYTFDLQDANHNLPAGITGALIRVIVVWAAASSASILGVVENGGSFQSIQARALVANIPTIIQGVVPVGTNDDVQCIVSGANTAGAFLSLIGYIT